MSRLRCLYVDLDGTLLGRGGSLLHDADGAYSNLGVRALEACHRAEVEVVLYSGRRRAQVAEDARLIGQTAFIFEVGAGIVIDGEEEFLTGDLQPDGRTIHDQIADTGAPRLLLERFDLEHHAPWHRDREVTHLFRGVADAFEVEAFLREHGLGHLRLVDNGATGRRTERLAHLEHLRVYHLMPAEASKGRAVRRHMRARGYAREECIAVGDSREDMGAAEAVATFWLVANALEKDPGVREAAPANVRIAEGRNGEGVYEAVVTTLAEGRG